MKYKTIKKVKKTLAILLAVTMSTAIFTGCGKKEEATSNAESMENKPDTWIADRHIVIRTFNSDLAEGPKDPINNAVAQEIKRLTGITFEVQYTSGAGSLEQLTTAFASGDMPDAIIYYLNDSSRPEFPVVLKGAKEGVLTDVAPYLKETEVYSKYYKDGYMPKDSYDNILQRPDLNGGTYHVPMRIEREEGANDKKIRGGMYIQKQIIEQLGINPWDIKTSEDLYNLAKKIKDGGFKDIYGNPIVPIGVRYWGGANSIPQPLINDMSVGYQSNNFAYINGELVHEIETDYVMEQIKFVRKLINEGLLHKEALTMEEARAKEGAHSYTWGIIPDIHSRETLFKECDYLPFELNNLDNEYVTYMTGKSQYGAWSIPSTTKNPEEVVKFADFMASYQGKLLYNYGIEGVHYNLVDGKPILTDEALQNLKDGNRDYFLQAGIYAGGLGSGWGQIFGETDLDNVADFGELIYGANTYPEIDVKPMELYNYGLDKRPYEKTIVKNGFKPISYLNEFEKGERLKPLLDSKAYDEIKVQAVFAKTEKEAEQIIQKYLDQLNKEGLQEFKQYLNDIKTKNPELVYIEEYK